MWFALVRLLPLIRSAVARFVRLKALLSRLRLCLDRPRSHRPVERLELSRLPVRRLGRLRFRLPLAWNTACRHTNRTQSSNNSLCSVRSQVGSHQWVAVRYLGRRDSSRQENRSWCMSTCWRRSSNRCCCRDKEPVWRKTIDPPSKGRRPGLVGQVRRYRRKDEAEATRTWVWNPAPR